MTKPSITTITPLMSFKESVRSVLVIIRNDPMCLEESDNIIKKKIFTQGQSDTNKTSKKAQGTGNATTRQELGFAVLLEKNGFTFIPKPKKDDHLLYIKSGKCKNGLYYIYQVNGTQQSIDFRALLIEDNTITASIDFDLKHTIADKIFLNDGWFHKNVIYVISWFNKKTSSDKIFIGLGQDIPTIEEQMIMKYTNEKKKKLNAEENKPSGSFLTVVYRCANQYSCNRFTDNFRDTCFMKTYKHLG